MASTADGGKKMQRTFTTFLDGMEAALELLPRFAASLNKQGVNLRRLKDPEGTISCLFAKQSLHDRPHSEQQNWIQRYYVSIGPDGVQFTGKGWSLGWSLSDIAYPDPSTCHWVFCVRHYLPNGEEEDPSFQERAAEHGWALEEEDLIGMEEGALALA